MRRIPPWLIGAAVGAVTWGVFFPTVEGGFVSDDLINIVGNRRFRGLGLEQLSWMFGRSFLGPYQPLTWLSFALDWRLWGLDPFGYRLGNLLLHGFNAVLFYRVAARLLAAALKAPESEARCAAAAAALLFSLHPLRVEPVAWITERRTLLAAFFYLAGLELYLARRLRLCAASFACSLLSKGIGVTLPLTLLILDLYPLRRTRGLLREKIPFALLALAFGAVELYSYGNQGRLMPVARYGLSARLAQASFGLVFYLSKTLFPAGLSPRYEWVGPLVPGHWTFLMAGLTAIGLTALFWRQRERAPAALAAWGHYLASVAPVLGLLQFGKQIAADRYTYLPCLGFPLLCAGGVLALRRGGRRTFLPAASLLAASLAACAVLSRRYLADWRDEGTLWSRALAVNPFMEGGHENLGVALLRQGRWEPGVLELRRALAAAPDDPFTHYNLGNALIEARRFDEAEAEYKEALRLDPGLAGALVNLGNIAVRRRRLLEAASYFGRATQQEPDSGFVRRNLAEVLLVLGQREAAIAQYREALALDPADGRSRAILNRLAKARAPGP